MLRVIDCIVNEHDLRILALALVLCFFASSTSLIMLQRGIAAAASMRWTWLCAAGFVTGIGIWATHFAGMLAFDPGFPIGFDPWIAGISLVVAVALSTSGWIYGFGSEKRRAWAGGALVGIALAGAHYLDATGIRLAGRLEFDPGYVIWSIVLGVPLCAMAARFMVHTSPVRIPVVATALLVAGIAVLHLVGMTAITLVPDPAIILPEDARDMNHIGGWVVGAAIGILGIGLALAVYDRRAADRTAEDHRRLLVSLEALKQSQEHYRFSVDLSPQIPWTADPDGNIMEVGPRWEEILGQGIESALG